MELPLGPLLDGQNAPDLGLSELIDRAVSQGPQTITRNGRSVAVIVSVEEWERKTKRKGNLAEFFAASPLRNSGLPARHSRYDRSRRTPRAWEVPPPIWPDPCTPLHWTFSSFSA